MQMVCLQSVEFWCSKFCGNLLVCGNYICRNLCYFVIILCIVVGEEVYVKQVVVMFFGIDLVELMDEFERVWGKYGFLLFNEKGNSNNLVQEILI